MRRNLGQKLKKLPEITSCTGLYCNVNNCEKGCSPDGLFLFATDCNQGLHFFEKFQDIPTKGTAAVKLFPIGDDLFLVFANYYGDKAVYKAKSVVYKMQNERFVLNQTLSTHGAYGIEHFTIDGVHYMAIANYYDGGYKQNSVIYKWGKGKFEEFQLISTNGASGHH